jgi:hypothetical protein
MEEENPSENDHPVGLCKHLRDKIALTLRLVGLVPFEHKPQSDYVQASTSLPEIEQIVHGFDENIKELEGGLLGMYYFYKHRERKHGHPVMFNRNHPLENPEIAKFHYKPCNYLHKRSDEGLIYYYGYHIDPLDDIPRIVWISDTTQIEIVHADSMLFCGHLAYVSSRDLKDFMGIKKVLNDSGYEDISKRPNQPRGLNLM